MSRKNISYITKYIGLWPNEFIKTPMNELYCNICCKVIKCDRKSVVTAHRNTAKHIAGLKNVNSKQEFLQTEKKNFLIFN